MRSLRDFDLVLDLAAGDSIEFWWIPYGQEKYGFPFVAGCTAVMAPDLYPISRLGTTRWACLVVLAGAAEYETLIDNRGECQHGYELPSQWLIWSSSVFVVYRQYRVLRQLDEASIRSRGADRRYARYVCSC